MPEYIERDAALNIVKGNWLFMTSADDAIQTSIEMIRRLPAADVRPVVLCRDCKHFQQFRAHDGFCQIDGMLWSNDFFCANGKREES